MFIALTPTMLGSLIAGVACWLLFWWGVSHVDSIPYLNQYLTRAMVMKWIRENPNTALILTEVVNVMFHGLGSAAAVFFTFAGTLVNATMIYGLIPVQGFISKQVSQFKAKAAELKREMDARKGAA
jgi:hypothetical protein